MPTDVKAAVSAVVILVALGLAFWSGSPIRPEFDKFVLFAVFFVVAMWIFPEAGGKKGAKALSLFTSSCPATRVRYQKATNLLKRYWFNFDELPKYSLLHFWLWSYGI